MPQPKKAQTIFADDLLPDDMPVSDMPQEAPTSRTNIATQSKPSKGLPSAKVDTGPVSISNPHPNMDMSRQAANFLSSFNDQDIGEEEEGANDAPPVEVTLPAIIQTALSTERGEVKSYQMANIVSQAPGPMQSQLKKVGRDIFSQYSDAPKTLKDIYAVTSLTNSETEVKLMLAWVVMHGRKISDAHYNFPSMPGYRPKAELWEADEARFLIVRETPKDFAGEEIEETFDDPDFEDKVDNKECIFYIYGWDEPKGKLAGNTVKAELLEAATQLANTDGAVTIQEAFNLLVEEYMLSEAGRRVSRVAPSQATGEDESPLSSFKKPSRKPYETEIIFYRGCGYSEDTEETKKIKFSAIGDYEALKMLAYITTYSTVKKPSAEEFEEFWNDFLEDNEGDAETVKGLKGFIKYNAEDYDVLYLKDFTGEIIFTTKKKKSNNAVDWDENTVNTRTRQVESGDRSKTFSQIERDVTQAGEFSYNDVVDEYAHRNKVNEEKAIELYDAFLAKRDAKKQENVIKG